MYIYIGMTFRYLYIYDISKENAYNIYIYIIVTCNCIYGNAHVYIFQKNKIYEF